MAWPLPRLMRLCAWLSAASFAVNFALHVYWYFGCRFTLGGVLAMLVVTLSLIVPAAFVSARPLSRAPSWGERGRLLVRLFAMVPPVLRMVLVFMVVYTVVVVLVFYDSLVDARQSRDGLYYVYSGDGTSRVEIDADEFCRIRREDASSSSAMLCWLSFVALTFYAFVFPAMYERADTTPEQVAVGGGVPSRPTGAYFRMLPLADETGAPTDESDHVRLQLADAMDVDVDAIE